MGRLAISMRGFGARISVVDSETAMTPTRIAFPTISRCRSARFDNMWTTMSRAVSSAASA